MFLRFNRPLRALITFVQFINSRHYCFFRRFGFANPDALAAGETGTACRGEEHDVTLVWSITSGKRLILADGQEVHYSSSRAATVEFSWTMRGNHVLKVKAFASPPMSANPGFRQYDFSVDGQSFFSFPKVFRLGLAANDRGASPQGAVRLADRGRNYASSGNSMRSAGGGVNVKHVEAPSNRDEVCSLFSLLACFFARIFLIGL